MMEKLVVQKPLVWNANGYKSPAGSSTSGGFVGDHGWGHEEWNGNPTRVWMGDRVFHTQSKPVMDEYGDGRLAILMTAYHKGQPLLLGAAAAVRRNTHAEMAAISRDLDLKAEARHMWDNLEGVRNRYKTFARFKADWAIKCQDMTWRAPRDHYVWLDEPVAIDVRSVFAGARREISKMHSACMILRPDQAIAMLEDERPRKSPILTWLRQGDFEAGIARSSGAHTPPPPRKKAPQAGPKRSASTPSTGHTRYIEAYEVKVSPRHKDLQKKLCSELKDCDPVEDWNAVDVRFTHPVHGPVLAEVKPCSADDARYAIRTAMGQLLDYQHRENHKGALLIVIEKRPASAADVALALSNGFAIAWPERGGMKFRWPEAGRARAADH